MIRLTMSELEARLDPSQVGRIHRSAMSRKCAPSATTTRRGARQHLIRMGRTYGRRLLRQAHSRRFVRAVRARKNRLKERIDDVSVASLLTQSRCLSTRCANVVFTDCALRRRFHERPVMTLSALRFADCTRSESHVVSISPGRCRSRRSRRPLAGIRTN